MEETNPLSMQSFQFIARKLLATFVFGALLLSVPAMALAATPGAHDSDVPNPCYDIKGSGQDVLVNGVANAGHINFEDPNGPNAIYEGCLRDLSGGLGTGPFRMEGWAWDSALGWVSFYCPAGAGQQNLGIDCSGSYQGGYEVDFDVNTGKFTGFAWGDNMGWIAFDNSPKAQMKAEVGDPQLLGLVYASAPHTAYDTHAWSDNVGWLNFDGVQFYWNLLNPQQASSGGVTVQLSPDPAIVNKNNAPIANNSDAYQIQVSVKDQNGQPLDLSQYQVTATPFWTDTVKKNQTAPNAGFTNADCSKNFSNVSTGAVSKPCSSNQFSLGGNGTIYVSSAITSVAPTSNMNGLDEDGDGNVDFSYETFYSPSNIPGPLQSNDLTLKSMNVSVKDMNGTCVVGTGALCTPILVSVNSDLKFRPSTEVTQLDDIDDFDHINITYGNPVQFPMVVTGSGTVSLMSGIDNSNPPIDPNVIQFTLDHDFNNTLTWNESSPNGMFWNPPLFAPPFLTAGVVVQPGGAPPQYIAGLYIYSTVADNNQVSYYSNKLPRVTGSSAATPVAVLQGNIYSTGATATTSTVQPIRSLGDVSTNVLRDTIFSNVARIVGSATKPTGSTITLVPDNQHRGFQYGGGDGTVTALLPDAGGVARVYYVTGDVHLDSANAVSDITWTGDRTIVVTGGNLYIDRNIYNSASSKSPLGIIVLRDPNNKAQGHVYVNVGTAAHPVTNIQAHVFADGSVFPYKTGIAIDSTTGEPQFGSLGLFQSAMNCCQLLWQGTIASENTVGGAAFNPPILGDGTKLSGGSAAEKLRAELYDLNFLRQYVGLTKQDSYGNYLHANGTAIGASPDKLHLTKIDGTPFSKYDTDSQQPGVTGDLIPPTDPNGGNPAYYESAPGLNWQKDLASTMVKYLTLSPNLPGFSKNAGGSQQQLTR